MTGAMRMPAMGAALISSIALLGWGTDHVALAAYLPGIDNMTFNTALCFMLAALSCCLPDRGVLTAAPIRLGVGLFVALLAVLTQLQNVVGLDFGIDNLLFDSRGNGPPGPHPGRMSPLTATGFLLAGMTLSLLSMQNHRSKLLVSITHAMILLLGLVGLSGVGINLFMSEAIDAHLASTSLFTAISFLLLATAILNIFLQHHRNSGMSRLLHSGVQLMYRLKYRQKFALISAVLVVPIAVLMWNEIKLAEHDVADARLKLTGIEHIMLDVELLKAVPEHRGMVNAGFSSPALFSQAIDEKAAQIDQLLNANARMDQLHAELISIPREWSKVMSLWAAIKEKRPDRLLQWQMHTEIIALIARHMREVGDESGLTFDANPFQHNLLTAQLKEMPELLEQIGQIRGKGSWLIMRKNITRDEQLMLAAMISRTDHYQQEIQRLLSNAPEIEGAEHLARLHNAMTDKIRSFIAMVEREFIANSGFTAPAGVHMKQRVYFQKATAVIDQAYKLYGASLAYVGRQLRRRINDRIMTQYHLKLAAMVLALVLLFLFAAFYRSVMNTITALHRAAESMCCGDADELATLPANDELGDVVESFNSIADELIRVNSHMRMVVDHTVDGIITIDGTSTIKTFNPAAERIFGYTADEALGRSITMLMPDASRECRLSGLRNYRKTNEGSIIGNHVEVQGLRKNGEEFPVDLSVNAVFIDDRQIFIGMVRDLSEQRAMEIQLRHAQKMEAIGALIGGLAHNFNNLLSGIIGGAYLARKTTHKQPEKTLTHLESIETMSAQAAAMVRQLMDFSHKNHLCVKKEAPLAPLIKEGFRTAKLGIAEDIDLSLNITAEEARVFCDAGQIQQVLVNMMNNARDAVADCAEKSISVSLDVCRPNTAFFKRHSELAAGEYARLQISDSGHGMDSETAERIFEPFYTTKSMGKGTGLGLSSAFGSIASHNGVIEVDSKPGSGAIFRVFLPLIEATETEAETDSNQGVIMRASEQETLLLVDDEPVILLSMQEVLEELGYNVLTACNGAEGLACFRQHQHDISVIITDIVMPEMGGLDMFRRIRSINSAMPIIFTTGYDQVSVQLQSDEKENTAIITKPAQISELSRLIDQTLKK